jgi:hypothetical protein
VQRRPRRARQSCRASAASFAEIFANSADPSTVGAQLAPLEPRAEPALRESASGVSKTMFDRGGFMKAGLSLILFSALAIFGTGCLARTAVISGEHNAYMTKSVFFGLLGSNMYHCTSEPKPKCKQVEESE